jgi:hypothetical protein
MAGINQTAEQYYSDDSNFGGYQYTTLKDIIDTFNLRYVGDDKLIHRVKRYDIVGHAKRGLQELNYDALKEIKMIEVEIGDDYRLTLPQDYVNYVRISTVDKMGNFRPMIESTRTGIVKAYLQDHEYNILFDEDGNALEGSSITEENSQNVSIQNQNYRRIGYEEDNAINRRPQFNLDASKANVNGDFVISKREGYIRFGSSLPSRIVVLEYVSDGLEYADPSEIKIHKLAENALYMWIRWQILSNKRNTQEYVVRRSEKDWNREYQKAKLRLSNYKLHQLVQRMRGRSNWIK